MQEIVTIADKYNSLPLISFSREHEDLKKFSILFSKDLAELSDIASRVIDYDLYPDYYTLNQSTIVGLMTKIIKLYNEAVKYYEEDKCEIFALFIRPIYESLIIIKYLIKEGEQSQRSFRLISYISRFKNYKKLIVLEDKDHPIIKRQLRKLDAKLKLDGFSIEDLEIESKKKKSWKMDGKSFWDIHKLVDNEHLYSFIYGVGSDFIHGNWQEILDFHLTKKGNGYIGFLNYEKCDCRLIVPLNNILLESLKVFLKWNNCLSKDIESSLTKMELCNSSIYLAYEAKFGEP